MLLDWIWGIIQSSYFPSFSLPSTYLHSLLPDCSAGSDPSSNSPQIVPFLSHGSLMSLTRFCFLSQLCFNFISSTRLSQKSHLEASVLSIQFARICHFLSQTLLFPQHFIWPTFDQIGPSLLKDFTSSPNLNEALVQF